MDIRQSMNAYPRFDYAYRKKHTFNFSMMKTNIMMNREEEPTAYVWIAYAIIGFFMGSIAFVMEILEKETVNLREYLMQKIIEHSQDNGDNNT